MPLDLEAIEKRWTDSDPYSLQLMPTRARLEDVDDLITEVRALRAALTKEKARADNWRDAAQIITPGGSEFCDPAGVREYNAQFKQDYVKAHCLVATLGRQLTAAQARIAEYESVLKSPELVHIALLRGDIAKPDIRSMLHVYGQEALARWDGIEAQGKVASAIDMIENCAGRPSNPDALVNMLLAHLKAATAKESQS